MPIIVCETSGHLAMGLRKGLPPGVSLIETRGLAELWQRLGACPAATVAMELTAGKTEPMMAALLRIGREFPLAVSIVLADRALVGWEVAAREAGAMHFIASTRQLGEIGEIVRRQMKCQSEHVADSGEEPQSIEQRILATLPWSQ
jgi:hypothetical protein